MPHTLVDHRGLSRRNFLAVAAAAGASGTMPSAAGAQSAAAPAGLKVLSAGSTLYGLRPVATAFSQSAGIPVAVATDHGHNIEKFALGGTTDADVVVIPTAMMTKLTAAARADKSLLVEIGAVRIGAAVHERAPRPDVAKLDAMRKAVLAAKEVLLTNAPTGDHLARVFAKIGIAEEVKPKLKRFDTATLLNKYIAEHPDIDSLGFGPTTEILTWRGKGVAMVGALDDAIQIVLPYQAGMLTRTQSLDGARKLLEFLATPPARKHFHDSGVE
jgi:molybdate transport system substrate-binding protein